MNFTIQRIIWMAIVLVVVLSLAYFFRTILTYILIAAVIGFIGDPVVIILRKISIKKRVMPRWLAALMTLVLFVGVIIGLVWMFAPLIATEIALLSTLDVNTIASTMDERLGGLATWFDGLGLPYDTSALIGLAIESANQMLSMEWMTGLFNNIFSFLTGLVASIFSVLFMSFFFLKDGSLFYKMVFTLTPEKYMDQMKNILNSSHRMLTRYFGGLFVQVLIMMTMVTVGLMICGVQNVLLIGVFAGLVNILPYLGPAMAMGFGLLVGITSGLGVDATMSIGTVAIKILVVFGVAQFVDNWFIQPLVVGSSVNTHPLELFIVLLASATIAGPLGMVLALPVYTILRIVAREFFNQFKVVETLTRDIEES